MRKQSSTRIPKFYIYFSFSVLCGKKYHPVFIYFLLVQSYRTCASYLQPVCNNLCQCPALGREQMNKYP